MSNANFSGRLAVVALLLCPAHSLADIPVGKPRPPQRQQSTFVTGRLNYREDARALTHRLVIPRKLLESALRHPDANSQGAATPDATSKLRTVVAGVALSLAAASVVLLRNRKNIAMALGVATIVAAGAFAAGEFAHADIVVPPPQPADELVLIEIVNNGNAVQFIRATGRAPGEAAQP